MTPIKSSDEILREREALDRQLEAALKAEYSEAILAIKAMVQKYKVPPEDIYDLEQIKKPRTKNPPKYRNPETGDTWTGRGPAPAWIEGKDRTLFLAVPEAVDPATTSGDRSQNEQPNAPSVIADQAASEVPADPVVVAQPAAVAPAAKQAEAKDPFFA